MRDVIRASWAVVLAAWSAMLGVKQPKAAPVVADETVRVERPRVQPNRKTHQEYEAAAGLEDVAGAAFTTSVPAMTTGGGFTLVKDAAGREYLVYRG